jgi:hypothetical protein
VSHQHRYISLIFVVICLATTAFTPVYSANSFTNSESSALVSPPAAFGKITPEQGGVNIPSNGIVLRWEASATANVTYQYCIRRNNKCPGPKWISVGTRTFASIQNLSSNVTYYWQVRAVDNANPNNITYADGGNLFQSASWSFTTISNPNLPGDFSKITPLDDPLSNLDVNNLALTWGPSTLASEYQYCFDRIDNNFCDKSWVSVGTALTVTINNLAYNTVYFWQVRAVNSAGPVEADYGDWFSFKTKIPPPAYFEKLGPSNLATDEPANPSLEWSASLGAVSYEYCIDESNDSVCDTSWVSTGASTSAIPTGLEYGKVYYWQVKAVNPTGSLEANGGTWWGFATINTPGSFTKINPVNGVANLSLHPWLYWSTSTDVDHYEYCINTESPACPGDLWTSISLNTFVNLPTLAYDSLYYWQVRAVNGAIIVYPEDSGWWSFSTLKSPPTVDGSDLAFSTDEDVALNDQLVANSAYASLAFNITSNPSSGEIILQSGGSFTYTPDTNYNGQDSFQFMVSDGHNPPAGPFTAALTINPVNDPPVLAPIPDQVVLTGQPLTFTVSATDGDLPYDILTYSIVETLPAGATFNGNTGVFTWTPVWSPVHAAPYILTVQAHDLDVPPVNVQTTVKITVLPRMIFMPTIIK